MNETETSRPPIVKYLHHEERDPSRQYREALRRIKQLGTKMVPTFHPDPATIHMGNEMRFKMNQGFPIITERKISTKMFRGALGEVIGFLNGATDLATLESFGCPPLWWERWVTAEKCASFGIPTGCLGVGSTYGDVWTKFPAGDGTTVNQWEQTIRNIMNSPGAFTHRITNWYPPAIIVPGKRTVSVAPCHGDVQIMVFPETKELRLTNIQRSGDVPVGIAFNLIEYAAVGMMLAHVLGYTFTEYCHFIVNSHIYDCQWTHVDELLRREARGLPTVTLDFPLSGDPVADFFAIRPEHFTVTDYNPHPAMFIPTPI